jgi:exodeoxyribonuclease VII large subunit
LNRFRLRYDSAVMNEIPRANVLEVTVSELAHAIKRTVEDSFGLVRLRGEISGFRGQHSSGHAYFAIKDERAKIDAVIWKGVFSGLRFKPEEGLEVIATGRVTTYPGKSSYQIIVEAIEPAGAGALMVLLEERKKKLAAEGLFDAERKRALPFLPRVVGVITSPTGAVIRDMLHGFDERFPACVLLWPVRVQGETCAAEVAAAIRGFNALGPDSAIARPDVLIVARGGGSLEDLWGFNEEIVVRACAESTIPIISAVGHETDWTLIDLASDARAPTPTKAAEWAVPKHSDLIARMMELRERRHLAMARGMEGRRSHLRAAARGLGRPQDLVGAARQRLDGATTRLRQSLRGFAGEKRAGLLRWQGRLDLRLITQRAERCHERVRSLDREMTQVVRRLVQQRHTLLGRTSGRLDIRLVAQRAERCGERVQALDREMTQVLRRLVQRHHTSFERHAARLRPGLLRHPAARGRERVGVLRDRADKAFATSLDVKHRRLDTLSQLLRTLSHKSVLDRGFVLVRDRDGHPLRRIEEARAAGLVELEFADGRAEATLGQGADNAAPSSPSRKPAAASRPPQAQHKVNDPQGQLF